jgi:BRCT domain type II-containing protein
VAKAEKAGVPILTESDLRQLVKDAPADGAAAGQLPAPRRRR